MMLTHEGKSQQVRTLDVLVLGPFMVWAGWQRESLPKWARVTLLASGIATIVYNYQNYARIQQSTSRLPDSE